MDVPAIILVHTVLSDAPPGGLKLHRLERNLERAPREVWGAGIVPGRTETGVGRFPIPGSVMR